jgi:hypothetical protein
MWKVPKKQLGWHIYCTYTITFLKPYSLSKGVNECIFLNSYLSENELAMLLLHINGSWYRTEEMGLGYFKIYGIPINTLKKSNKHSIK